MKSPYGAPDKKTIRLFNSIEGRLIKKRNASRVVLAAVCCFAVFAAADPAGASTIAINPDKTINVNGKKTFPVYMYGMCESHFESNCGVAACDPSKNSEFTFSIGPYYSAEKVADYYKPLFEQANEFFILNTANYAPEVVDSSSMFGYINDDEPELHGKTTSYINSKYLSTKTADPAHPVMLNICCEAAVKWMPYTDILTWDVYTIKKSPAKDSLGNVISDETSCNSSKYFWDSGDQKCYWYGRSEAMYAYEHYVYNNLKITNSGLAKPMYAVLQGQGVTDSGGVLSATPREIRANSYTAVTMNVNGLGYWGYLTWGGSTAPDSNYPFCTSGLYNNPPLHTYYRQLGKEITGLNDILVLPTTDYSWEYRKGSQVSFSKTLAAHVLWKDRSNFNYMLKRDADKTYLIVVNKDSRPISEVELTVAGLSGSMTATTLGLETTGSSKAGRVVAVSNGRFTDSFDGYAAHIYQISSGSPITPAITVTEPDGGENLTAGAQQTVTWTSTGAVGNVNIDISTNSGTTWSTLVSNTANDGSQAVTIPNTPSTACRMRVRESDGSPADASNSNFTIVSVPSSGAKPVIDPNGFLSRNGSSFFPVSMEGICNAFLGTGDRLARCAASLAKTSSFIMDTNSEFYGDYANYVPKYEAANKGWTTIARTSVETSPWNWFMRQYVNGTSDGMDDEPGCGAGFETSEQTVKDKWNASKANNPGTLVVMGNWRCFNTYLPYTDIYIHDAYMNGPGRPFARENVLYAQDGWFGSNTLKGRKWNDPAFAGKSVWQMIGATSKLRGDLYPLTKKEVKGMIWVPIAAGANGIGIWGYQQWSPNPDNPSGTDGLIESTTIYQYFADVQDEIQSLNYILTLPHKAYSWEGYRDDSYVNISPNAEKDMCPLCYFYYPRPRRFTYLLKQPDASTSYLIVVNKDTAPVSNVQISVGGISGARTVKFLGNETSGSGRSTASDPSHILAANNGSFIDTFDGQAVHIYKISSGSILTPAITVTAPNGGQSFAGGSERTVTWTSAGAVGNVNIDISTNSGTTWSTLVSNTANDGSQAVTIPNTPSTACRMRVQEPDGSPSDASNSNFTITTVSGYKISGKAQAYKSGLGISGLSGVTLALGGKAGGSYTTKDDGNYEFAGLAGGDYSITAVKSNWRFWPREMRYAGLSGDKSGQNFIGMALNVRATVGSPAPVSMAVTPLSETSSEASAISVLVPEGAFPIATELILTAIDAPASDKPAMRVVGYGVSIVSDKNQQPVKEITITMTYDKIAVSGYKEEKLVVGRYDELNQRWIALPTTRSPGENRVVGLSDHISRFALLELLSADDLSGVKAYPSPYNPAKHPQGMKLEGLTAGAAVKIYTVTGGLIRELKETGNLGSVVWDGKNESGKVVASGVYIAHIKGATGVKKIKLAVEK